MARLSDQRGDLVALIAAGRQHLDAGELEAARQRFEDALQIESANPIPLFELGRVDVAAGRTDAAIAKFGQVLANTNDSYIPALFETGCALEATGHIDRAMHAFAKILEKDKTHRWALSRLAGLYRKKQMPVEASYLFARAAELAHRSGVFDEARRCAAAALEIDEASVTARWVLSQLDAPQAMSPAAPTRDIESRAALTSEKLLDQELRAAAELAAATAAVTTGYRKRLVLEVQTAAVEQSLERLKAECSSAERGLASLNQQREQIAREIAEDEATRENLAGEIEKARDDLEALNALREKIREAEQRWQKLSEQLAQTKAELAATQAESANAHAEADAVKATVVTLQDRLSEAAKKLDLVGRQLGGIYQDADRIGDRGAALNADITAAESQRAIEAEHRKSTERRGQIESPIFQLGAEPTQPNAAPSAAEAATQFGQAERSIWQGDYQQAVRVARSEAKTQPDPVSYLLSIGELLMEELAPEHAIRAYESARAFDRTDPRSTYALANAHLGFGRLAKAVKLLQEVPLDSEFAVRAQVLMARCFRNMGRIGEAEETLAKALEIEGRPQSEYHDALYELADLREAANEPESFLLALASLKEIAAVDPHFRDVSAKIQTLRSLLESERASTPS